MPGIIPPDHGRRVCQRPRAACITSLRGGWIPHMPVSAERYKELLSHVASGVAVITTGDLSATDGRAWAFTAISYCGVSLDPPLVLFCLERSADCHEAFLAADR